MRDLTKSYRPNSWDEIVGQEVLVKTLKKEIETNTIGHAYLFCGPRGTGKTTTARVFADNINATVIEMDAASNNGVDNIRELREDVQYLPTDKTEYKVYVIDEVHMLSTAAQNAFLKLLEEPPEHVIFVLATTDPQKLAIPVLSRCQRFDLQRITIDDIIQRLAYIKDREGINAEYDALKYIAESVDGGMRDAIKLLQKCSSLDDVITVQTVVSALGSVNVAHLENMTNLLIAKDIKQVLITLRELIEQGIDIRIFLANMIEYITELMSNKIINNDFEILQYMNIVDNLTELLYNMRNSTQIKTLTELQFIKICRSSLATDTQPTVTDTSTVPVNPMFADVNLDNSDVDPDLLQRIMSQLTKLDKKVIALEMTTDMLQQQRRR